MRFNNLALLLSAIVLAACGGDASQNTDTSSANAGATDSAAQAGAAGAQGATAGTAAAVTGTMHTVKMVGDAQGYRFEPVEITIKQGDGIKWEMVSGGPHNVAFDPAAVPADVKGQLAANMPNQMSELASPMMMNAGESYTISFANVKQGSYEYFCTPHLAMNMKGKVTIQ